MWTTFGQGASTRWIPIHEIVMTLGSEKTSGMPFFHTFSGCDTVSAFCGKGKKSTWQTWIVFDNVSGTFTKLSQCPRTVDDHDLQILERFVIIMYDRSSAATNVDDARLDLFARKQRSYNAIPPTSAALKEHVKHAAYQAGIIWGQATIPKPNIESPADWGWKSNGDIWQITWADFPPIATSCQELTKCSSKKDHNQRCKYFCSGFTCTGLCGCPCQH